MKVKANYARNAPLITVLTLTANQEKTGANRNEAELLTRIQECFSRGGKITATPKKGKRLTLHY